MPKKVKTKDSLVIDIKIIFTCPDTGKEVTLNNISSYGTTDDDGEFMYLTKNCPACGGIHEYI